VVEDILESLMSSFEDSEYLLSLVGHNNIFILCNAFMYMPA
jgi:hypothetical protein